MASVRTFIAIETPREIREKIGLLQKELRNSAAGMRADVRWESEDKFHATIKFLGDVDETLLPEVSERIRATALQHRHCEVAYENLGCFPNNRQPRVLWVGCSNPDKRLESIKTMLDSELESLGFEIERRAFRPHITLGRIKTEKNISHLISMLENLTFEPQTCTVAEMVFMKSVLKPQGSEYSVLGKFQLS